MISRLDEAQRSPFVRGLLGSMVGTILVLVVVYMGYVAYTDHRNLAAVIKFITDAQQRQAAQAPKPPTP